MKTIQKDTQNLKKELSSVIEEYSIVKPKASTNEMVLGIRKDLNEVLHAHTGHYSHDPFGQDETSYDEDLKFLKQQANGMEFDEEIEEIEESLAPDQEQMLSEENLFLSLIFAVLLILAIVLYFTRKRRMNRQYNSQVTKYKSLSASFG